MNHRLASFSIVLAAAVLCSACIVLPSNGRVSEPSDVARMSEQAAQTCGAGQVKEVNAKSFSCK